MTLGKYKLTLVVLQSFVLGASAFSVIFDHKTVPFPPLGDEVAPWRMIALLAFGIASLSPYYLISKKSGRPILGIFLMLFIVFAAVYLHLMDRDVLTIHFADGSTQSVIIGSERQPDLKEPYRSMKDDDLVESTGLTFARLSHAYIPASLRSSRESIFGCYVAALSFLEFLLGSMAKMQDYDASPRKQKVQRGTNRRPSKTTPQP